MTASEEEKIETIRRENREDHQSIFKALAENAKSVGEIGRVVAEFTGETRGLINTMDTYLKSKLAEAVTKREAWENKWKWWWIGGSIVLSFTLGLLLTHLGLKG